MSTTAKGRLPSKPLSYRYRDLCTKEEIMIDYSSGRLYVRLTDGRVVDITAIVLEDIRNFDYIDEYIHIHVPESGELVTIKAAYVDIIDKINNTNKAIRDLQDPNNRNSLYNILTRNYINADTELFNRLTADYTNADAILKSYINKLFAKLGLVYHEEDDTYTIGIQNAYIIHDGVSEIYNIPVSIRSNTEKKITNSFYIYKIPVSIQNGYSVDLNSNTDRIISRDLFLIDEGNYNTEQEMLNKIEEKTTQIKEYQSIAHTTILGNSIYIFSDYPITSSMNIVFVISRN